VPDNPRIEELRRRVQKDPASIAFAQLAEEYRRAGSYQHAIETCRTGLQTHPGYLSARVTLGRALIETSDLDGAQSELEYVLEHAPENLAAIRGMAQIHHRRGSLTEALISYKSALALAKHDPDLEQTVDEISRALAPATPAPDPDSALPDLERFLDAIHSYRQRRAV
jgi:tetratricopeptide (TPR) repeat protein